ncbi:cysteine--tRNA ligase [Dictyobacter aurantiacus]|nr:cysteine--tRNA ligase [Dictyobacter aurantiacus]
MKIYNTLTRRVEEIVPLEPGVIKMYSCGPTVYRNIHIGNLRTFTMADWLRRAFEYRGYQVLHVKNITDVGHMRQEMLDRGEDKIIAQARKEGKTSAQIAQFYTRSFLEDEASLHILPAHVFPRATQHVPEMIAIVQRLLEKGLAYEAGGNVYYDTQKFRDYGKLSGNEVENMVAANSEAIDPNRHHQEDFALWKLAEAGREMAWDSPWGRGFPGWHIECSAMSMKYLGEHFDIHTGGVDNIFPHHEDEIAQSEGYSGGPFVNYWVHAQHLLADGQKMAKSTGNAYIRTEIEQRGFDPLALRMFYTTALYRSRLNFTFRALQASQTTLTRLRTLAYQLFLQADQALLRDHQRPGHTHWDDEFLQAIEDDLNLPRAMSIIWRLLRSAEDDPTTRLSLLLDFDRILGFDLYTYLFSETPRQEHDPAFSLSQLANNIKATVLQRDQLRQQREYTRADQLRQAVNQAGYALRDTRAGTQALPRRLEDEFHVLSSSRDVPNGSLQPDLYDFSINLIAHNNRTDLERCIQSICRHAGDQKLEILVVENGSTDDTLAYLQHLARQQALTGSKDQSVTIKVLFVDHNMGFGAGRNATLRASRGKYVVLLDTSIELKAAIWPLLCHTLDDPQVGLAGPYGLVTNDLRDFEEAAGPAVDAIEGYLMAFRRSLLHEVGWFNEKFRFYRLADVYYSFMFKTSGYQVVTIPQLQEQIIKHPHREWYSLNEEEQRTKSKKNYDIFRTRWHHGQSLLTANYQPEQRWFGHDHPYHLEGDHTHPAEELPEPGTMHSHKHQHWPDHDHEHPHYHTYR